MSSDIPRMPSTYDEDISREPDEVCLHEGADCQYIMDEDACLCNCIDCKYPEIDEDY